MNILYILNSQRAHSACTCTLWMYMYSADVYLVPSCQLMYTQVHIFYLAETVVVKLTQSSWIWYGVLSVMSSQWAAAVPPANNTCYKVIQHDNHRLQWNNKVSPDRASVDISHGQWDDHLPIRKSSLNCRTKAIVYQRQNVCCKCLFLIRGDSHSTV